MSVESAEDLASFFDSDEHATVAVIGINEVEGIFDSTYVADLDVVGEVPVFVCAAADVVGVVRGTEIVINSTTYEVVNIEPDGTGVTKLILEDQS